VATYENRRLFKLFWGHTTKLTLPKNYPHFSTWVDKFLNISRNFLNISIKKIPEKVATYGGFGDLWSGDLWKEVVYPGLSTFAKNDFWPVLISAPCIGRNFNCLQNFSAIEISIFLVKEECQKSLVVKNDSFP